MKNELKTPLLALLAVTAFLGGVFLIAKLRKEQLPLLPFYGKQLVIQPSEYFAFNESLIHTVKPAQYTNQLGQSVGENNWKNKIIIANYIFTTCPGICKDMTRELRNVYKKYESNDQVVIVSHTSKPEEDSVAVLFEFAKKQGITNHTRWQFLTGNIDTLFHDALHDYLIINADDEHTSSMFVHTERVALIDTKSHIRGFYDATSAEEVTKLMSDIDKLLSEEL